MYLDDFYSSKQQNIHITPEQGSRFAKEVADDFNPLHNPDSKRFCVPGDLLFSLTLARFGISQSMTFQYTGMVGKNVDLIFPEEITDSFTLSDNQGKSYLTLKQEGSTSRDAKLIADFTRSYVAFSGHSFPHILVPLMQEKQVMINPERPMVIYEGTGFKFNHPLNHPNNLSIKKLTLKLADNYLDVTGKRGLVKINFDIMDNNIKVGEGYKTMIIGGLRPYNKEKMDAIVKLYQTSKKDYLRSIS